jgi:hypothetical protein
MLSLKPVAVDHENPVPAAVNLFATIPAGAKVLQAHAWQTPVPESKLILGNSTVISSLANKLSIAISSVKVLHPP